MKICVGTAQFNKYYKIGKRKEFRKKDFRNLKLVLNNNLIFYLDTAKNYGNAEKIIGKYYFEERFKANSLQQLFSYFWYSAYM